MNGLQIVNLIRDFDVFVRDHVNEQTADSTERAKFHEVRQLMEDTMQEVIKNA